MNKIIKYTIVLLVSFLVLNLNVNAATNKTYVNLETLEYSTDNNSYSSIKEYNSLDDFLTDYNSNSLPNIYITSFLFDGVSSVKTPDLDDFIENSTNDTKIKT